MKTDQQRKRDKLVPNVETQWHATLELHANSEVIFKTQANMTQKPRHLLLCPSEAAAALLSLNLTEERMSKEEVKQLQAMICSDINRCSSRKEILDKLFSLFSSLERKDAGADSESDTTPNLRSLVLQSELEDKQLATTLLEWACEPHDDIPVKHQPIFSKLHSTTKNKTARNLMALLCVHQYSYGSINTRPKSRQVGSLAACSETHKNRGENLLRFIRNNPQAFGGTVFADCDGEDLYTTNLYTLLDEYKKKAKSHGVYDMDSENCKDSSCCGGVYWNHYTKINKVTEEVREKLLESKLFYLDPNQREEIMAKPRNTLYTPSSVIQEQANKIHSLLASGQQLTDAGGQKIPRNRNVRKSSAKKTKGGRTGSDHKELSSNKKQKIRC